MEAGSNHKLCVIKPRSLNGKNSTVAFRGMDLMDRGRGLSMVCGVRGLDLTNR